jgi:hypothetical protein
MVIAAELTVDSPDFGHLEPMVSATETELARVAISTAPEVVLADAVYWHQVQMEAIVSRARAARPSAAASVAGRERRNSKLS